MGSAEGTATVAMAWCATRERINAGRRGAARMQSVETEKSVTPRSIFVWASANAMISVLEVLFVLPACVNLHRVAVTVIVKTGKRVTRSPINVWGDIAPMYVLTRMKPESIAGGVLADLVEIHREDIARITNKMRMRPEWTVEEALANRVEETRVH